MTVFSVHDFNEKSPGILRVVHLIVVVELQQHFSCYTTTRNIHPHNFADISIKTESRRSICIAIEAPPYPAYRYDIVYPLIAVLLAIIVN